MNKRAPLARQLLLGAFAFSLLAAGAQPQLGGADIFGSGPLGSVVLATLTLHNPGPGAATVLLREALSPADSAASAREAGTLRVPLPESPGPITAQLLQELEREPGAHHEMIAYLADQADLSAAAGISDWNDRGAAVASALQEHARHTQRPLLDLLAAQGHTVRRFWIVNAILVRGDLALAQQLASHADVALVAGNHIHALDPSEPLAASLGAGEVAWGQTTINAPSVWDDWGVTGAGIVVASIDTGVAYQHPTLLQSYRGWSDNGVVHDYNWFDAAAPSPSQEPFDTNGHGTHTMGTLAGRPNTDLPAIGTAPGARWMTVRGCAGTFCADAALLAAAEWLLAPTDLSGANPRPDLRPHIINNSWGKNSDDDWYVGYVTAWNAAGMFSVFANGNAGVVGICGNSNAPASYAHAFAVGATNASDFVADFSSRGPAADGRTKPEITAPGVQIASAWPDGSLRNQNGTSMAAPHVAGVAALLWSANPALIGDIDETRYILTETAVRRPSSECGSTMDAFPNNAYGWGRVDARQAVEWARVDVPWLSIPVSVTVAANSQVDVTISLDARQVSEPGQYSARVLAMVGNTIDSYSVMLEALPAANTAQITGRLTDLWSGQGIYGKVSVGDGPLLQSSNAGYYTATLPHGAHTLTAQASGYFSASAQVSLPAQTTAHFVLKADLPHLELASGPISATLAFGEQAGFMAYAQNTGSQPLSVTISVPAMEWVVEAAGVAGSALHDLSASQPLSLKDDMIYPEPLAIGFIMPIYGMLVEEVYLSSNGWVSAVEPQSASPFAACLPAGSLPAGSLAPFWADLDPSQGGVVRAGPVGDNTFVVSFEAVPPWRDVPDPFGPTYTFQLVLHASGQVDYVFGDMGALPTRWSMGAHLDPERSQRLACHESPAALSGLAWTLRNQPQPAAWLAAQPTHFVVPPGGTQPVNVTLSGFGYAAWQSGPMLGQLRFATNDPGQAMVHVPAQAIVGPAPYSYYFPLESP